MTTIRNRSYDSGCSASSSSTRREDPPAALSYELSPHHHKKHNTTNINNTIIQQQQQQATATSKTTKKYYKNFYTTTITFSKNVRNTRMLILVTCGCILLLFGFNNQSWVDNNNNNNKGASWTETSYYATEDITTTTIDNNNNDSSSTRMSRAAKHAKKFALAAQNAKQNKRRSSSSSSTTTTSASGVSAPTILSKLRQQQQQQQQQQQTLKDGPSAAGEGEESSNDEEEEEEYYNNNNGDGNNNIPTEHHVTTPIVISSHKYDDSSDGPPKDLIVHGKRDYYTPCPKQYAKHAYVSVKDNYNLQRALRTQGWTVTQESEDFYKGTARILFKKGAKKGSSSVGLPWQRYSRIPGFVEMIDTKDGFAAGFARYQHRQNKKNNGNGNVDENLIYFLPETYRLGTPMGRKAFQEQLDIDNENHRHRPWVLKKTRASRGRGVEMLPPKSNQLYSAIERSMADLSSNYIVQAYVCNELTWFGGEKFDLRFYWMVASIDPIIVMYHDGFVRVGEAAYNETDFHSTKQHLTNSAYSTHDDEDVLADALWRRVTEHYEQHKGRLQSRIVGDDPVRHVRNQLKEAISTTVEAFKDVFTLTRYPNVTTENLFAIYGCDFIIDADLDVYYVEAQDGPQMKETHDFRVDLYRRMLRPMVNIVEEIAIKQETDAKANILPINSLGEWEIVYAGDWRYRFEGYERSKDKKGCTI